MRLMYVASVEVETKREVDTEAAMKLLADYSPNIGTSSRGWVEVHLRLSATGLAHACTKASALARAATGAESIACQVMTAQEHRARFGGSAPEPPSTTAGTRPPATPSGCPVRPPSPGTAQTRPRDDTRADRASRANPCNAELLTLNIRYAASSVSITPRYKRLRRAARGRPACGRPGPLSCRPAHRVRLRDRSATGRRSRNDMPLASAGRGGGGRRWNHRRRKDQR